MAVDTRHFINLKPVPAFQTLMLARLGKCAATHEKVFLGQELLLDFAKWINLTSNTDNLITIYQMLEVSEHILLP